MVSLASGADGLAFANGDGCGLPDVAAVGACLVGGEGKLSAFVARELELSEFVALELGIGDGSLASLLCLVQKLGACV